MRLTADVDPDVKKRVKLAAVESESSASEWVERAVVRELERNETLSERESSKYGSAPPHDTSSRMERDTTQRLLDAVVRDRDGLYLPPPGSKPKGSENPPKLKDGSKISDAVIEDRR